MGMSLLRRLKLRHFAAAAANPTRLSSSSSPFRISSSSSTSPFSTSLQSSLFSTGVPSRTWHLMWPIGVAPLPPSQLTVRRKSSETRVCALAMPVNSTLDKYEIKGYSRSFKRRFEVQNNGIIRRWKEGNSHGAHTKLAIWTKEEKELHSESLFVLGKLSNPHRQSCSHQSRAIYHILMNNIPFSSSIGRNQRPKFPPFSIRIHNPCLKFIPFSSCVLHFASVGHNPSHTIASFRTWATISAARANRETTMIPDISLDYLAKACGFARKEDIKPSLRDAYMRDLENSLLVLDFFKENGFDNCDIGKILNGLPTVLSSNVDKTLLPKIQGLRDAGFSQAETVRLVSGASCALHVNVTKKINFLRRFFGSNEMILKAIKRNPQLLSCSHHERLLPNLDILKACGVSVHRFPLIMLRTMNALSKTIDRTRETIDLVQKFGFTPGSNMFDIAFCIIGSYDRAMIDAKREHFRNLGMSKEEVLFAISKCPHILGISKKEKERKMTFLRDELHLKPSYISRNPHLILFSLENRMKPRHHVLQALKMKGALVGEHSLSSVMRLTDHAFSKKYISPFLEKFPEISGLYLPAPELRS